MPVFRFHMVKNLVSVGRKKVFLNNSFFHDFIRICEFNNCCHNIRILAHHMISPQLPGQKKGCVHGQSLRKNNTQQITALSLLTNAATTTMVNVNLSLSCQ